MVFRETLSKIAASSTSRISPFLTCGCGSINVVCYGVEDLFTLDLRGGIALSHVGTYGFWLPYRVGYMAFNGI
jgi:hypothetical protein